jgi:DNA-binding NtrC family response regulator
MVTEGMISESEPMPRLKHRILPAARCKLTIHISRESANSKEIAARIDRI